MLDLLIPPACPICSRFLPLGCGALCPVCDDDLPTPTPAPTPAGAPRAAALSFDGPVRDAILALKFRRQLWRARPLGKLLAARLPDAGRRIDTVVHVPLHRRRLRARGFDQAAAIARAAASSLGVPHAARTLRREVHAEPQSSRPAADRAIVEGTYVASPIGGTVLLIDDVSTSGNTLDACAEALRSAGTDTVIRASVAFTPAPVGPANDEEAYGRLLDGGGAS